MRALRRLGWILEYALGSLGRRRGRTLGLLLCLLVLSFLAATVVLLRDSLRHEAQQRLRHAPELVLQQLVAGRPVPVNSERLQEIGDLRGVRDASCRLWGYMADPSTGALLSLVVPLNGAPEAGTLIVGSAYARLLQLEVGAWLSLPQAAGGPRMLQVVEVLPQSADVVAGDTLALHADDFRAISGTPAGQCSDLALRVRNQREQGTIAEKVQLKYADMRALSRAEILRSYEALFDWRSTLVLAMLGPLSLAMLVIVWERASGLSSAERREIGILRGLGWGSGDILLLKTCESLVIAVSGTMLGLVLAWAHLYWWQGGLLAPVLQGWSLLFPALELEPRTSGLGLWSLVALLVVPYALAGLVPGWRAATRDPDAIMRGAA